MLATWSGAKRGVISMITRPAGTSTYKVLSKSSGRQSAGPDAAKTSAILGRLAAGAAADEKASAHSIKILKLGHMNRVLHKSRTGRREGKMPRIIFGCLILLAGLGAAVQDTQAGGQGYPGGGRPGMGGTQGVGSPSTGDMIPSAPSVDKPDAAATKAYKSGVKSLNKAHEYEEIGRASC